MPYPRLSHCQWCHQPTIGGVCNTPNCVANPNNVWALLSKKPPFLPAGADSVLTSFFGIQPKTLTSHAIDAPTGLPDVPSIESPAHTHAPGKKIFIGHGGSSTAWKDLRDFIRERLDLTCDEFNRKPVAGKMVTDRLSTMLNEASFAFLVFTGEITDASGTVYPRPNVVHELGLFQARLGFSRAIIILEDGCTLFSNMDGMQHIRFPKGNIKSCFGEVCSVLKAAKLLL